MSEQIKSEKINIGGVNIQYLVGGDPNGQPELLWHGFLATSYVWRKVMPVLTEAGYSVLAPDMRGYGDSDKPDGNDGYDARALAEATGNTRWFSEQVAEAVRRVVLVNRRAFEVVKDSVKKTDKNDAINLAKFLKADLLPEVRAKSEKAERMQSLVNTRTKLVRLKTGLVNKIHALYVARGRKLKRASLSSEKRVGQSFVGTVECH